MLIMNIDGTIQDKSLEDLTLELRDKIDMINPDINSMYFGMLITKEIWEILSRWSEPYNIILIDELINEKLRHKNII